MSFFNDPRYDSFSSGVKSILELGAYKLLLELQKDYNIPYRVIHLLEQKYLQGKNVRLPIIDFNPKYKNKLSRDVDMLIETISDLSIDTSLSLLEWSENLS